MRGISIQPLPSDVAMWWSVSLVVLDLIDVRPWAGLMRKVTVRVPRKSQGIQAPSSSRTVRRTPMSMYGFTPCWGSFAKTLT